MSWVGVAGSFGMLKDFIFMSGGDRSGYYSGGSVFLRVYFMN